MVRESAFIRGEFTVNQPSELNPINVEVGERIKLERQRIGLGQAEFAGKVGISKTSQFNYEAGVRSPDALYLSHAHLLGVDIHYLVTGQRVASNDDFVVIPRYDIEVSAGAGAMNHGAEMLPGLSFSRQWLARHHLPESKLRVVSVTGDSMFGRLNDGDQVLINVAETTPKSGRAYVLLQGDELLVKYCQLMPDGILRVSSENKTYPPYDIDLKRSDSVSILGRVVASMHEW